MLFRWTFLIMIILTTLVYPDTLLLRVHLETDFTVIFLTELHVSYFHLLPDKRYKPYGNRYSSLFPQYAFLCTFTLLHNQKAFKKHSNENLT